MSITGLSSGLKTDEIIAKIIEYAGRPKQQVEASKTQAQEKLAAWQDLNTRVLALKLKCDSISQSSGFGLMTTSSSDTNIVRATASANATAGDYYIKVTQRAQAHQVASQSGAYTSANDIVGTGTVTIALNNGTSFELTLDSNNNTLGGLRDAINKANGGMSASIMNAGTTSAPDYRLVLTSTATGEEAGVSAITVDLAGGTAPTFDLVSPVQKALNAVVVIGGGDGATPIEIEKSSNTITDVIPGVTLNIAGADAAKTVRISVSRNVDGIKQAIQDFVGMYNSLMGAIRDKTYYDAGSGSSGTLLGDYQLQSVHMAIESAVGTAVSGLSTQFRSLATVGITTNTLGQLSINDSELTAALNDHPSDVARLFDADLDSGSSYVSYVTATPETNPSGSAGWNVSVTQAAQRARVTAGVAMTGALASDEDLTVNGTAVALTAGMDIDQVIAAINAYSSTTSVIALKTGADGTGTGDYISFRRTQYGSSYEVRVVSGLSNTTGNTTGLGNVLATSAEPGGEGGLGQGIAGLNVAGTINGEAATGLGQILSLSNTSTNAAKGLSLLITAGGPLESVNVKYTKGIGAALRDLLVDMTSTSGAITSAQDGITSYISDLDNQIADLETRLADQELRLWQQFNAMETQLSKLQAQGNYITAQLSSLNNNSSS
jgi:flagellar hook-associated protein 2